MEGIMVIGSSVFLFLLVVGFFIGFARGWCRSLIRFSIVIVDFAVSLLISPLITSSIINKFSSGSTITIFSYQIDFNQIAENMFEANLMDDLNLVTEEVEVAAKAILNVAVNIALFIVLFFVMLIVSLIIYWVVLIIVKSAKKHEKKEKPSPVYTRFIGGAEGFITTFVIGFVLLVPLFGAMNICNKFLNDNLQNETQTENVTSALSSQNVLAGQLYYTDDAQIGKFENYIEKYSYVKDVYDKSVIGKVFNFTRLGKIGSTFFDYLTRVKYKDDKVKFSDEAVVVIETYNLYKEAFKQNTFDITKNESLDLVEKMADNLVKSKVFSSAVESVMPTVLENWSRGEKFLGIQIPMNNELKTLITDALNAAKEIKSASRLNYNAKKVIETIKILNNHNIIESAKNNTIFETLKNDETVVYEVVLSLSNTEEISNNMPVLFDDLVEIIYNRLTQDNQYTKIDKDTIQEIINWENEAQKIQAVANVLVELYNDNSGEEPAKLSKTLNGVGVLLDRSKESVILSSPIKNFITAFIDSESFANEILNDESKESLVTYINDKWSEEETEFKFEKIFGIMAKMSDFADNFAENENVQFAELKELFEEIISTESLKADVKEFIETNVVDEIVKNNDFEVVAYDLFKSIVYNSTVETLDDDINAGQALVDLGTLADEFDNDRATENLETIAKSDVFMNYIDSTSKLDGSSNLQKVVDESLSPVERGVFIFVIESSTNLTSEQKEIFDKLFLNFGL